MTSHQSRLGPEHSNACAAVITDTHTMCGHNEGTTPINPRDDWRARLRALRVRGAGACVPSQAHCDNPVSPHPTFVVNGTNQEREVQRPTLIYARDVLGRFTFDNRPRVVVLRPCAHCSQHFMPRVTRTRPRGIAYCDPCNRALWRVYIRRRRERLAAMRRDYVSRSYGPPSPADEATVLERTPRHSSTVVTEVWHD